MSPEQVAAAAEAGTYIGGGGVAGCLLGSVGRDVGGSGGASGARRRHRGRGVGGGGVVGGGVGDTYGEDCATEDQLVTPWTVSVAR